MARNAGSPYSFKNIILAQLSSTLLDRLASDLKPIELEVKQVIYEAGGKIQYAYFVESGMISVVSIMEDGRSIEVGTIGREGMAGGESLSDAQSLPYKYFVQISGEAYRIPAEVLKKEVEADRKLRDLISRYQSSFLVQAMQSSACNGLHSVQQRCCRWILMARHRVETDKVPLTQEFLALMLGVRRASVSEVLQPLQELGWVQSNRGEITILDRKGLEAGTCECYAVIAAQFNRLLR